MVTTDPIADMLTRIRNAISVNNPEVNLPHSKSKEKVARILAANGYLSDVKTAKDANRIALRLTINDDGRPATITEINRLSKPGRRLYVGAEAIPSVKRGRGLVIISTSQGMMTGAEAKKKRLGGELICKVY